MALEHLSSYLTIPSAEFDRVFAAAAHRVGERYCVGLEAFVADRRPELGKRIQSALASVNALRVAVSGDGGTAASFESFKKSIAGWEEAIREAIQLYLEAKNTTPSEPLAPPPGTDTTGTPVVAVDTEATGLNKDSRLLGISWSLDGRTGTYRTVGFEEAVSLYQTRPAIFFNAKFDFGVLERHGLALPVKFEDVMLMAHLLDENRSNRLKDLAEALLSVKVTRFEEVEHASPEEFARYAEQDAVLTHRLYERLLPQMEREGVLRLYRQLELPLVEVIRSIEKRGIGFDAKRARELAHEFSEELGRLRAAIGHAVGRDVNPNSSAQLAKFLFEDLRLRCTDRTAKGRPSVKDEILDGLREKHPAIPLILEFRRREKVLSTYLMKLPELVDGRSGRIHPDFIQTGTETGRLACKSPNVQNIPTLREVRELFVAGEGNVLIGVDYSQVELRVLAHYSEDEALSEAFTCGEDVHLKTARAIFGKDTISGAERSVAKIVNFGIIYGMGARALARTAGIGEPEAARFILRYLGIYRGVRAFRDRVASEVRRTGRVVSMFGRIRRLPEVRAADAWIRKKAERDALNSLIQGTASDLCKIAMLRLHRAGAPLANMVTQVHDEILFEVPAEGAEQTAAQIKEVMEQPVKGFRIPLLVECKVGRNWADCK